MTRMLTHKQVCVLHFIDGFIARHKYAPTRADIATHFGWASPNAADTHVEALIGRGALVQPVRRALQLTPLGLELLGKGAPAPAMPALLALPVIDSRRVGRANWGGRAG